MINVTQRAKQELNRQIIASVDWPHARYRLLERRNGKLGLEIDIETPDDQVVKFEGKGLLVVEHALASKLKSVTLDIDNTRQRPALIISNDSPSKPLRQRCLI